MAVGAIEVERRGARGHEDKPTLHVQRQTRPGVGSAGMLPRVLRPCFMTGLAGPVITIWCQVRGWPKDTQRAIFQPVLFITMTMTTTTFAASGHLLHTDILRLFLLGLPALLVGLWVGVRLYGRLDDAAFRKVILVLLLFSGLSLIVPLR